MGKSTLIRRVLASLDRPVFGFETKKEDALADEVLGSPIYIYEAGKPHTRSEENLVGHCKDQHPTTRKEAFDRYAQRLRAPAENGIIVLDELGFMETASEDFCEAVLHLLDGQTPVIAAVKDKELPFLNKVRSHENAKCFHITRENRDTLLAQVQEFIEQDAAWQK